jgi:hypothetical protein
MAVDMLATGHAGAFRVRLGCHKTGPLTSGMTTSLMAVGGKIGGVPPEFRSLGIGPTDRPE